MPRESWRNDHDSSFSRPRHRYDDCTTVMAEYGAGTMQELQVRRNTYRRKRGSTDRLRNSTYLGVHEIGFTAELGVLEFNF